MDKKLTDYIWKNKVIDDDICQSIVEEIEGNGTWKTHTWYNHHYEREHSYDEKELEVCFEYPEYVAETINLHLNKCIVEYTRQLDSLINPYPGFYNMVNAFSRARFNRYKPGMLMRPHYDHIQSLFDGNIRGIPVLSVVGCLNDDYEGGEFIFYEDYNVELKRGEVLLFPSIFLYPHRVEEVTSGVRHTFVSWGW